MVGPLWCGAEPASRPIKHQVQKLHLAYATTPTSRPNDIQVGFPCVLRRLLVQAEAATAQSMAITARLCKRPEVAALHNTHKSLQLAGAAAPGPCFPGGCPSRLAQHLCGGSTGTCGRCRTRQPRPRPPGPQTPHPVTPPPARVRPLPVAAMPGCMLYVSKQRGLPAYRAPP